MSKKNESKPPQSEQPLKPPARPNVLDDFKPLTHGDQSGMTFGTTDG